jgi:3-methylcrotonyl-CoA carboxylase alpha subunit
VPSDTPSDMVLQAAAHALLPEDAEHSWTALIGFRMSARPERRVHIEVAGRVHTVERDEPVARAIIADVDGDRILFLDGEAWRFGAARARNRDKGAEGDGAILSPMPGCIVSVEVKRGEAVKEGQRLLVLEAMKMEHGLVAPFDGTVAELRAEEGRQVLEGALLVRIEAETKE